MTVLRLAGATTYSFTVVAVDPSLNASAPSAAVTATTQPSTDTTGPTAPGNLIAWDFGCETWLFWDKSVDDVDPQFAILYEFRVNGVFDGTSLDIEPLDHVRQPDSVEHVHRAGDRQRRQPLSGELHHARQPVLLRSRAVPWPRVPHDHLVDTRGRSGRADLGDHRGPGRRPEGTRALVLLILCPELSSDPDSRLAGMVRAG